MSALTVVSLAVAALAAAMRSHRPAVVASVAGGTAAGSLLVTVLVPPHSAAVAYLLLAEAILTLVVIARTVRRLALRPGALLAAALVGALGLSPLRVARGIVPPAPLIETVAVCATFVLLGGLAVIAGRYLRALDHARVRIVEAARREQRLRIARDLHDWFAHEVTGIVLEAQAARLDADPATAETFARIESSGLRALASLDRALALARDASPAPGLDDLREVVARFARSGPMAVRLDAAPVGTVCPEVADAARRVVVEALTNVRRHARGATQVVVRLRRDADTLVVSVTDNGQARSPGGGRAPAGAGHARDSGPIAPRAGCSTAADDHGDDAAPTGLGPVRDGGPLAATARGAADAPDLGGRFGGRGGTGLAALREHVGALGGTLWAGPDDAGEAAGNSSGWTVRAELPAPS